MSGWDVCTMEPNGVLRWIECHPSLAGYIQAVGVIATVAIAIFGPPLGSWIAGIQARIARKRQTIKWAKALLPSVNTLIERIDARISTLGTYDEPDDGSWNIFHDNIMIELPGALDIMLVVSGNFDADRGACIKRLNDDARGYNKFVMDRLQLMQNSPRPSWEKFRADIFGALRQLKEQALETVAQIRRM